MPDLEEVKKIAKSGEYKVLPVSTEILSDICTPIEAVGILKNVSDHCYMLESVAESERWGRYTFLGFEPKMEIACLDGEVKAGGEGLFSRIFPLRKRENFYLFAKNTVLI